VRREEGSFIAVSYAPLNRRAVTLYSDGWARDLHDGCGGRHWICKVRRDFQASNLQGAGGGSPCG
jgi:hypothetical protein